MNQNIDLTNQRIEIKPNETGHEMPKEPTPRRQRPKSSIVFNARELSMTKKSYKTTTSEKDPNEPYLVPLELLSQFTRGNNEICFLCARKMVCLRHNPSGGPLQYARRRGQKPEDIIDKKMIRGLPDERGQIPAFAQITIQK